MKMILEEYGEIILAIVGAVGAMGISIAMLWEKVSQQVQLFVAGL